MFNRYLNSLAILRRQVKSEGLGRVVHYLFERYGLQNLLGARASHGFVRALKIAAHPIEFVKRRRMVGLSRAPSMKISEEGYLVTPSRLPNSDILIEHLMGVFERRKEEAMANYQRPYAILLSSTITDQGPVLDYEDDWEPIIDFCCQPEIVSIVAQHMKEVPVLGLVSFLFTPRNDEIVGSQFFHSDNNYRRMVHLLLPIRSVVEGGGPFTFLPRQLSARIKKNSAHKGMRLTDENVFSIAKPDDVIKCVGDAGQGFFVNPFHCLHQGARARTEERLVMIISYTSRFEGGESIGPVYRAVNRGFLDNGNPLRKRLLALP